MFEVSFYTPEGVYTLPLSRLATSFKKAKSEADFLLHESDGAPAPSHVKDMTIWRYSHGKLVECHTWFFNPRR